MRGVASILVEIVMDNSPEHICLMPIRIACGQPLQHWILPGLTMVLPFKRHSTFGFAVGQ
eukprot:6445836-Karenia_brevis.AAC.1